MGAKVLLADSSITIRKVIDLILKDKDYDLMTASNGKEALIAVSEYGPEIVLADTNLKDIDGYELSKMIKSVADSKNTRILLLSGAFNPIDEARLADSGADGTIIKPFEAQELLSKLDSLLSLKKEEPEAQAPAEPQEAEPAVDFLDLDALMSAEPQTEEPLEVEIVEEITDSAIDLALPEVQIDEELQIKEYEPSAGSYEDQEHLTPTEVQESEAFDARRLLDSLTATLNSRLDTALEGINDAINTAINESVSRALAGIQQRMQDIIAESVSQKIGSILEQTAPVLTEQFVNAALSGSLGRLRQDIENAIWETVPELAESMVKETIENIRKQTLL